MTWSMPPNQRADSMYFTSCKSNEMSKLVWLLCFLRSSLLLQVTKQMKKLKQSYGANIHSANTGRRKVSMFFVCYS